MCKKAADRQDDTGEADLSRALADLDVNVRRLAPGIFALSMDAIPFTTLRKRLERGTGGLGGTASTAPLEMRKLSDAKHRSRPLLGVSSVLLHGHGVRARLAPIT